MDTREHRLQLGVVGALVVGSVLARRPRAVLPIAVATTLPLLPQLFRRCIAPRHGPPTALEDARLRAFARIAGGAGLVVVAGASGVAPSAVVSVALLGAGAVCIYGSATGYCVPCSALTMLERAGLVELDPPLVCAVRF